MYLVYYDGSALYNLTVRGAVYRCQSQKNSFKAHVVKSDRQWILPFVGYFGATVPWCWIRTVKIANKKEIKSVI